MNARAAALASGLALLGSLAGPPPVAAVEEVFRLGRFGDVRLYHRAPHPSRVVLFVSGDGGWNAGVVDMARALADMDALVVGINILVYLEKLESSDEKCSYPAADFELLSKAVQQKLGFPEYVTPSLLGYSSGATLVYAVLVQAPPGTFRGAISMGFCPDLPLKRAMCPGNGLEWTAGPHGKGYSFLPASTLEVPWIALAGQADKVCGAAAVDTFVRQVPNGTLVLLPKVGHGFSVPRNWLPQLKSAVLRLDGEREPAGFVPATAPIGDLPVVEVPAHPAVGRRMAMVITGDGGWGATDRGIARALAGRGVPVVGLNALHYFWKRRTPQEAGADLERILRHYRDAWQADQIVLIGYSMGADVLPFLANRLPAALLDQVRSIVLVGPSREVDFQAHVSDWFGEHARKTDLPVLPEVEKLRGRTLHCYCGDEEEDSLCPELEPGLARVHIVHGGHRVVSRLEAIADTILATMH